MLYLSRRTQIALAAVAFVVVAGVAWFFLVPSHATHQSDTSGNVTTTSSPRYQAALTAALNITREAIVTAANIDHRPPRAADLKAAAAPAAPAIELVKDLGQVASDPRMVIFTFPGFTGTPLMVCLDIPDQTGATPVVASCPN